MRAINVFSALCVLAAAAIPFYLSDEGGRIGDIVFGEMIFSPPIVIAWLFASSFRLTPSRRAMLVFEILYAAFAAWMFHAILTGEHDAQWQLAFLEIPMVAVPAAMIVGFFASLWERRILRDR